VCVFVLAGMLNSTLQLVHRLLSDPETPQLPKAEQFNHVLEVITHTLKVGSPPVIKGSKGSRLAKKSHSVGTPVELLECASIGALNCLSASSRDRVVF